MQFIVNALWIIIAVLNEGDQLQQSWYDGKSSAFALFMIAVSFAFVLMAVQLWYIIKIYSKFYKDKMRKAARKVDPDVVVYENPFDD